MKRLFDKIYDIDVVEKLIGPNVDPKIEEVYKRWSYNGIMYESVRICIYEYLIRSRESILTRTDIAKYNKVVERLSKAVSVGLISENNLDISVELYSDTFTKVFNWFGHTYYADKFNNAKELLYNAISADGRIRNAIANFHLNKKEYTDAELAEISGLLYDTRVGLSEYADKPAFISVFTHDLRNAINIDISIIEKYDLSVHNLCEIMVDIINDENHDTKKLDEIVEFLYENTEEISKTEVIYCGLFAFGGFII